MLNIDGKEPDGSSQAPLHFQTAANTEKYFHVPGTMVEWKNQTEYIKWQEVFTVRKCIRCSQEMVEDLTVTSENSPSGLRIAQGGVFKDTLGRLKAAVCPECGYTEFYIDRLDKIKKIRH